ncbi:CusA/CzcA family heavy metal efflux RND transporter, partial [Candidatus Sumerlaeota bacterium]|nr:CusA/CzcA family heavy metal efflux RND transporter [Candidatus Sumerlaeota bacterium]
YEHPNGEGATKEDGKPGWQNDGSYLTPEGERLTADYEKACYLRTVQDWIIRPQIKGVKDVAAVDSIGGYEKQYQVQPDPMKLVSYGFTFQDVIESLEKNNVSTGAGFIEHKGESYTIRSDGRVKTPDEIGSIVLGRKNATPIHISDVAQVGIGKELRTGSASLDGNEAVVGTTMMLIGANSRTVSAAVDSRMEEVKKSLPPDIGIKTVLNRTALVDKTISTIRKNLTEGAILVIVILFLMLGNLRAALITALAIPLSMLITSTAMVQFRVSGNLMSLGAIDFGIIIDGAVIIVENCLRMLAEKQHELRRRLTLPERLHEVMHAARQMIQPSTFGQAIIITVYLPILALTGTEGKMFRPMALTVIFALAGAFVLSLTFIPAMVAVFISGKVREKENWFVATAKRIYGPVVELAVLYRFAVVGLAVGAFAAALAVFTRLGQEFVPTLNEGDIIIEAVRIPSTGITQSTQMQLQLERALRDVPEISYVFSKTGTAEIAADPMPPNASDFYVMLKPLDQWPDRGGDKAALIERIGATLEKFPGSNYGFSQPIQMRFNELIAGIRSDVGVLVHGDDFEKMLPVAQSIARVFQSVQGSADVVVEPIEGLPVLSIDTDLKAIARYGLNVADVQDVIAIAIGGRDAGLVFEGDRRFDIVVRLPEAIRDDLRALEQLPIPLPRDGTDSGGVKPAEYDSAAPSFIPLSAVARITVTEGPNQISRENGKRRIVVQSNVRGRDIVSFVAEAQRRIDAEVPIPPGSWLVWGGQFQNLMAARKRLTLVVPLCFFIIFLLLFTTFNSVKYALMVFSGVPLALTGGIMALWLRWIPFSISAAVGFIALSGVAVLNGLVMVTFINHLRKEGAGLEEAIIRGSLTRLRPVLMTALVASLGFLPMALARGTGAEVQKPLATVVIGGIISSTFLTLVVLPALYRICHRKDEPILDGADPEHLLRAEPVVD